MAERMISLLGVFVMVGIAVLFSKNRSKIDWKLVSIGIGLQIFLALVMLRTDFGQLLFNQINSLVNAMLDYSNVGASFLFGSLTNDFSLGATFAFRVLPTILFFSALMSILYYLGILQFVVKALAKVMSQLLGTSGAETLSASANIFVGQTEAPLLIKPYVEKMTLSELMVVMTGGFATVAGGVMAAYVGFLSKSFPDIAGHLATASIMSAPAALVMAKILVPETEVPETAIQRGEPLDEQELEEDFNVEVDVTDTNVIEAAASGTSTGLELAMNVGAMLIVFIALVAMVNGVLGWLGTEIGMAEPLSLQLIFGWIFAPIAWVMGVPWKECITVGGMLGTKLVLNEFVAYQELSTMLAENPEALSQRTVTILTYALCGFANFSSIGIQLGGIGGIAPSRKGDLARLGLLALLGGTLACFQTATIAGVLVEGSSSLGL